jgi:hypothetical protein
MKQTRVHKFVAWNTQCLLSNWSDVRHMHSSDESNIWNRIVTRSILRVPCCCQTLGCRWHSPNLQYLDAAEEQRGWLSARQWMQSRFKIVGRVIEYSVNAPRKKLSRTILQMVIYRFAFEIITALRNETLNSASENCILSSSERSEFQDVAKLSDVIRGHGVIRLKFRAMKAYCRMLQYDLSHGLNTELEQS